MGGARSKLEGTWDTTPVPIKDIKNEEELYFDMSRKSRFQQYQVRRLHGVFRRACALGKKQDVITSHAFCQFFSNPQADRQGEPANTRGRRNSRVSDKSLNGEAGHGDGEGEKKKPKRSRAGLFFRGFAFSESLKLEVFVRTMDKILNGDRAEKVGFLINCLDPRKSGKISKEKVETMIGPLSGSLAMIFSKNPPINSANGPEGEEDATPSSAYCATEKFRVWAMAEDSELDIQRVLKPFDLLPTVEMEKAEIKRLFDSAEFKVGSTWFVLSQRWWQAWKEYTSYDKKGSTSNGLAKNNNSAKVVDGKEGKGKETGKRRRLRPISIENADLAGGTLPGELKQGLVEGVDYSLVPKSVWVKLVEWYGGGPEYPRKTIELGKTKLRRVEVFPLVIHVFLVDSKTGETESGKEFAQLLSSQTPIAAIHMLAKKHFQINPQLPTRLWVSQSDGDTRRLTGKNPKRSRGSPEGQEAPETTEGESQKAPGDPVETPDSPGDGDSEGNTVSIGDCDIIEGDILLIEKSDQKNSKGGSPWPLDRISATHKDWRKLQVGDVLDARDKKGVWYRAKIVARSEEKKNVRVAFDGWDSRYDEWISIEDESKFAAPGHHSRKSRGKTDNDTERRAPTSRGVSGLSNLGNTCFMNSTLQCLSNTPIFNTFFSGGRYQQDVNKVNPLGTRGKLAHAFGSLLQQIWSGNSSVVTPSSFKRAIGHHAPRFSGYQQQDSQELLAYLLDGLHEDLNRVKKKRMTNTIEAKGRPDHIVAEESWQTYQLRNRSVIVDLFMGQLKSTVVCPNTKCGQVSVTFDPFMYLSVPFPRRTTRKLLISVVHIAPRAPASYVITVEASGHFDHVIQALSEACDVPAKLLVVGEVYKHKIFRILGEETTMSSVTLRDIIVAYEMPAPQETRDPNTPVLEVPLLHTRKIVSPEGEGYSLATPQGLPLMIEITDETTHKQVHQLIARALKPFLPKELTEGWFPVIRIVDKSASHLKDEGPMLLDSKKTQIRPGDNLLLVWKELDVLQHYHHATNIQKWTQVGNAETAGIGVHDCIEQFCKKETLSKEDAWYCSKCKDFQQATKKLDLYRCPEILIVHLKRFIQRSSAYREKINHFVDFPIKGLNLSQWVVAGSGDSDAIYDLYAVSNHMGGIHGGHYTAYARNHVTNRWYLFDDSRTREVNINNVKSSAAYVLYYRRRH